MNSCRVELRSDPTGELTATPILLAAVGTGLVSLDPKPNPALSILSFELRLSSFATEGPQLTVEPRP